MKHFNQSQRSRVSLRRQHMAGLSLIELMVAVALGLLILTGLVTVFVNSSAARNEVERTSRQIENGRYAVEVLSDDLRLAGFYGELGLDFASASIPPADPPISVPAALPDPCSTTVADWAPALYLHVQGYDASNGGLSCMPASYKAGTDVMVVRRVRACAAGVSGCDAAATDKPYLQVSSCAATPAEPPAVLGLQGTAAFNLRQKDCATLAVQRQYFVNIYFISTNNVTGTVVCPGSPECVPTLKRLDFTGAGWTETPLVEGIEQINIEYGIDYKDSSGACVIAPNRGDGLPDAYTADPTNFTDPDGCATTPVSNWIHVVTARFYVLARNIEPSPGYKDEKTYQLGSVSIPAASDNYRRHVYASLVRIVNPAGRRDTP